jgi:membrane protein
MGWATREDNGVARLWRAPVVAIVRHTLAGYGDTRASQAAAGLAYYILFSLFPLLLVLVTVATYFWNLESKVAFQEAVSLIEQAIPVSRDLISESLSTALELRGPVGLIGLVGTIWSASGAFATLTRNINLAWSKAEVPGFVRQRLTALAMVGALILLLFLSVAATTLGRVLPAPNVQDPTLNAATKLLVAATAWSRITTQLLPLVLSVLLFIALYRWVPTERASWRAVLWGGGLAGIAWEVAKIGFSWFVSSGLASYKLVYGSLGGVIALLFWIYLSASIALFGAHLTASIDSVGRDRQVVRSAAGEPATEVDPMPLEDGAL